MAWQDDFRQHYPVTADKTYVNIAYTSPISPAVSQAIADFLADITYARSDKPQWLADADALRIRVARLLGGHARGIAFTKNTTEGLNIVAQGLDWQVGDNIVIDDQEHPTNAMPWLNLRPRGVEVRVAVSTAHRFSVDDLWAQVNERTRVVAVSWVQYSTGFRIDLAELGRRCKAAGIWLVVDGIQGAGLLQVHLDQWHIDAFAAGTHKGLLGPLGVGFLHVSPGLLAALRPAHVGPSGATSLDKSVGHWDIKVADVQDARRLETGNLNFPGLAGFARAVGLLEAAGPEQIEPYVLGLSAQLKRGLLEQGWDIASPQGEGEVSTTTSLRVADPKAFHAALTASGIVCTVVEYGLVRLSVAAYNNSEDVAAILAVTKALGAQSPA